MDIRKEIAAESQRFVSQNKGLVIDRRNPRAEGYISPRISSEFMDCSMPMTFDHYSHCSLGCVYCFAYFFKSCNPCFDEKLHSINANKLIEALNGKPKGTRHKELHKHFFHKKFLFHWGGLADPFCNFEKTNKIGLEIVKALGRSNYPTLFSFKGSAIFRPQYKKVFEKYAKQKNFAFQVSIVVNNDEMSRDIEIGVPVTSRRIEAIRMLSDMGYYTILRLRPYIIGISDQGIEDLLGRCLDAGIQAVSLEFFAMDHRSSEGMRKRYKWIAKLIGVKELHEYFKTLSPSERGGYMRLNRLVKESHAKIIFKFCQENDLVFGCSDPDYKELNTSGSCCGMPDKYPENKLLQNWTKNQLTYALKEARKQYHLKGQVTKFTFDKVFKDEDTYLNSTMLGQDHVTVSDKTASERRGFTYMKMAKMTWNNLRSPSNPRNYFHGKMLPIGIDGAGNYMYKYVPSEYEDRWAKEGIDLTR